MPIELTPEWKDGEIDRLRAVGRAILKELEKHRVPIDVIAKFWAELRKPK